jgi:hypothetical protein
VVNRQLSLNFGGGRHIVNDDTLTTDRSGLVWSIGATYRPGPRVTLSAAYNNDFETKFWTYSGTYNVSPRTSISFNHTETVQTTQEALAQRQPVLGLDGIFRDPVTLLPVNPLVEPTGLQNDTQLLKVWNMTASSRSGRNTYSINLNRVETTIERTGQVTTDSGVVLSYGRALTHRLNANLSANYRMTDTENAAGVVGGTIPGLGAATANGSSTQILLNGTLGYTLTPETSLSFILNYSAFDGGAEQFNSHEKSATIGLRRTF